METVYIVHVGGSRDNHTFTPNRIDTLSTDSTSIISFVFGAGDHAVMRSEWGHPCDSWADYHEGEQGFFSISKQEVDDENNPKIVNWTVTTDRSTPVLFHCAAPDSCGKWGMVGTINPGEGEDIQAQARLAKEQWSATVSGGSGPSSTASPTSSPDSEHHHSLSTGAIAGIAVGCALAALLLSGLAFFVWRHKRLARKYAAAQAAKAKEDESKGAPTPMLMGNGHGNAMGSAPMSPGMGQNGFYGGAERGAKQEYRSVYEQGPPGYDYKYGAVEGGGAGLTPGGVPHGPDEIGAMRGMSMSPMSGYGGAADGTAGGVHSRYSEVPGSEVERRVGVGHGAVEMDAERR